MPVVFTATMCVNSVKTLLRTGQWNSPAIKIKTSILSKFSYLDKDKALCLKCINGDQSIEINKWNTKKKVTSKIYNISNSLVIEKFKSYCFRRSGTIIQNYFIKGKRLKLLFHVLIVDTYSNLMFLPADCKTKRSLYCKTKLNKNLCNYSFFKQFHGH